MGTSTETPVTPQRRYEHAEFAAMMRRMLRGWGRRLVEEADVEDLEELARFGREVEELQRAVAKLWQTEGRSWADIGRAFGITRQAAQQRFGNA